jgi:hypothetical protein
MPDTVHDEPGLENLGRRLQEALSALFGPSGGNLGRPADATRAWGLQQTTAIRLFQAMREPRPLTALQVLPSANTLRSVLDAARRAGVAPALIDDTDEAIGAYADLLQRLGGKKAHLDTIVSRHVDHSREKIEHNARQMIFRGTSSLFGAQAETSVVLVFVFPGEDPDWCDELAVYGFHRLLRLRSELPLLMGVRETMHHDDDPRPIVLETLHGESIPDNGYATALRDFSTSPMPYLDLRLEDGKLLYVLGEEQGELPSETDLFFASIERKAEPRWASAEHPRARSAFVPNTPSRHAVFDMFIHKDVWQGVEPELVLARTGNPGSPDLLAHSLDRLDFVQKLEPLGSSISAVAHPQYRDHADLVRAMHERMGWALGDFRLYRCSIKYPVLGLWYTVQFPLRPRPTGSP